MLGGGGALLIKEDPTLLGFRVWGLGFRVWGLRFSGLRLPRFRQIV